MYSLYAMNYTLEMDRPVNFEKHYISPGSYELEKDGRVCRIDFNGTEISKRSKKILNFHVKDFDEEYARDNDFKNEFDDYKDIFNFHYTEFFIFTGEYNDEEINVSKLINLTYTFCDVDNHKFIDVDATPEQLLEINRYFKDNKDE